MLGGENTLKNLSEKEKGYLFGLFEGDGYKFYNKKARHYYIEYYLNSGKDEKIVSFIKNLFGKIDKKSGKYLDKRFNCIRIRIYSKELYYLMRKNISLDNKTKNFNLGYISGLIDAEGYANKKKSTLVIVNTNKKILENIFNELKRLDVKSRLSLRTKSNKDKLKSYNLFISVKFKNIPHLSIKARRLF